MNCRYPHLIVTPRDGNAFSILGATISVLRSDGVGEAEIEQYREQATAGDYDHLVCVTMEWVDLGPSP